MLAINVANGSQPLAAREPNNSVAVLRAERILGANPRPIYAFVGLLHPELGTVGLIITPDWVSRCLQGASRCDSGGFMGRMGAFACVADPDSLLPALSYCSPEPNRWLAEFLSELAQSYPAAIEYVSGTRPNCAAWKDVRAECIEYGIRHGLLDRRLWTWEIRLHSSPTPQEIECVVLSPEMRKRLEILRRSGVLLPDSVRLLPGSVTPAGVHWFAMDSVYAALLGEAAA
jgi:hypothetical protein